MQWSLTFGREMALADDHSKFTVYSRWVQDIVAQVRRGEPFEEDKTVQVFFDVAERHFQDINSSSLVHAQLAIIHGAFERAALNGHIRPVMAKGHILHFDKAENIALEAIDWLWNGHLALGMLEIISGQPEQGKSQVQCDYAARVTNGWDWPDGSKGCQPSNVIMLAAEDSWSQVVIPRLLAAGADMGKILYLRNIKFQKTNEGEIFMLQQHVEALEVAVKENNVRLVTIDPITAYMGGKIDAHKATEVRNHLQPLKELAERCHCAVSILTHPAKNASNKARDQFLGSQAFFALARIGHFVVEDADDKKRKLFTNAKNNIHEKMDTLAYRFQQLSVGEDPQGQVIIGSHVVWETDPVEMTADQALAAAAAADTPVKSSRRDEECESFIKDILANGPVKANDIKDAALAHGLKWSAVQSAQKSLKIRPKKFGAGKGSYWQWELPSADIIYPKKIWDRDLDDPLDPPTE